MLLELFNRTDPQTLRQVRPVVEALRREGNIADMFVTLNYKPTSLQDYLAYVTHQIFSSISNGESFAVPSVVGISPYGLRDILSEALHDKVLGTAQPENLLGRFDAYTWSDHEGLWPRFIIVLGDMKRWSCSLPDPYESGAGEAFELARTPVFERSDAAQSIFRESEAIIYDEQNYIDSDPGFFGELFGSSARKNMHDYRGTIVKNHNTRLAELVSEMGYQFRAGYLAQRGLK